MATKAQNSTNFDFRPLSTLVEFFRSRFSGKASSETLERVNLFQENPDYEVVNDAQFNFEHNKSEALINNFTHKFY